ncbi:MAG: ABC transporter permease [Leptospiraceae bacterium]|nr:ABC transporter permease [Leptospiraceae bacterium]
MQIILNFIRFIVRRIILAGFLIRKHFWRHFFSSIGLLTTLFIVAAILGTLRPLKDAIVKKMEGTLPGETLRVTPAKFEVPPLAFFSKQRDLALGASERELARVRALPGVVRAEPTQIMQTPAVGRIEHPLLAHMNWQFDVMLQGITDRTARPYLQCLKNFQPTTIEDSDGKKIPLIPILAPATYADIASAYAMINGLPAVQPKDFLGVKIRIILGRSVMGFTAPVQETVMGQLCGFLPPGIVSTIGAPLNWVRNSHLSRGMKKSASHYDQIFVTTSDPKNQQRVVAGIQKLGLKVAESKPKYKELYSTLSKADYILWGFAGILLILTTIALFNAFTLLAMEKKYEFGLFLVFGASPFFLWFLMFIEGAFWGALHGALAILLAGEFFPFIMARLSEIPFFASLNAADLETLQFVLSSQEKWILISATSLFSGIASLLPAIIFLGKSTLSLVKKD